MVFMGVLGNERMLGIFKYGIRCYIRFFINWVFYEVLKIIVFGEFVIKKYEFDRKFYWGNGFFMFVLFCI